MKMTMHLDEAMIKRLMKSYGYTTKTEAVTKALEEMDRVARLKELLSKGMGFSPDTLANSVYPDYDVMATRMVADAPNSSATPVVQKPVKYRSTPRAKSKRSSN